MTSIGDHSREHPALANSEPKCIEGAKADETIKATSCQLCFMSIGVAGDANSAVELYNGAVSGADKRFHMSGAAAANLPGLINPCMVFPNGLHMKVTDAGGTIKVNVSFR